jgi:guanylate kinase
MIRIVVDSSSDMFTGDNISVVPMQVQIDGKDYFFLDNFQFAQKVLDGSMLEATSFRAWMYGTPLDSLDKDKINIGVFNIAGIECLMEDPRLEIVPIYVEVSPKNRLMRALTREENPDCHEICRRFLADVQDFAKLENDSFDYYGINNDEPMDIEAIEGWIENIQSCFEDSES